LWRGLRTAGVVLAAGLAASLSPATAAHQQVRSAGAAAPPATRAEAWRRLREAKAGHLHAYVPKGPEKFAVRFEDELLPRLLTPRTGVYPFIGRITSGAGFAVGPGYRRLDTLGGDWSTYAAGSIKQYWQIESRLTWANLARGKAFATAYGRYYRFPREDFFGLGPDSRKADKSDFDLRQGTVGVSGGVRPRRWVTLGGTTEYFRPRVEAGGDNGVPNAEQIFRGDELPGFGDRHAFMRVEGFADVHTAEPSLNPRRGGRYRAAVARYVDLSQNDDRFTRVDVDLQQYASILNERRVFVLRALGSFSDVPAGAQMPFYLMRTLGGGGTLRGVDEFRFRDRHLVLLQAEYRFEIITAIDGAVFYDTGMVAPRLDAIRAADFERDWGLGVRFGSNGGVFMRIDVAFGGPAGIRTWLRWGHVF
jgi:hypothetical protein